MADLGKSAPCLHTRVHKSVGYGCGGGSSQLSQCLHTMTFHHDEDDLICTDRNNVKALTLSYCLTLCVR